MNIRGWDGLRKASEFASVFESRNSLAERGLVLHWLERESGPIRVGFCVGRKLGSAIVRNRIKRLLKESWRRLAADVDTPADLVFVARSGGVRFSLDEWTATMRCLLSRAGIIGSTRGENQCEPSV